MLIKLLFLFFFSLNLLSSTLESIYFVKSESITIKDIIPTAKDTVLLYKIEKNRHSKKIKSKSLIKLLASHGYKNLESSSRYIRFIIKSPIDLSFIESNIIQKYESIHPSINISSIQIIPRGYIKNLPNKYEIILPRKFYLSNKGTLHTKTLQNQKIFFDYLIDATIHVYVTKNNVQKATQVSLFNTRKQKIQLRKLKAIPITHNDFKAIQFKRNIKINTLITHKDVQALYLVKKGSNTVVNFDSNNLKISFSAKALQSGKLHDIITVQKRDMKRLRVEVVGKNQVQIR